MKLTQLYVIILINLKIYKLWKIVLFVDQIIYMPNATTVGLCGAKNVPKKMITNVLNAHQEI